MKRRRGIWFKIAIAAGFALAAFVLVRSSSTYITFFWGAFDPEACKLLYVNAGHWPPLLVRGVRNGPPEIRRLDKGGPVLGLLPVAEYEEGEEPFSPGELLLLYSDGVVEASDPSGAEFGEERIVELLRTHWMDSPEELRDKLLEALQRFTAGAGFSDDVTVVAARARSSRPTEE